MQQRHDDQERDLLHGRPAPPPLDLAGQLAPLRPGRQRPRRRRPAAGRQRRAGSVARLPRPRLPMGRRPVSVRRRRRRCPRSGPSGRAASRSSRPGRSPCRPAPCRRPARPGGRGSPGSCCGGRPSPTACRRGRRCRTAPWTGASPGIQVRLVHRHGRSPRPCPACRSRPRRSPPTPTTRFTKSVSAGSASPRPRPPRRAASAVTGFSSGVSCTKDPVPSKTTTSPRCGYGAETVRQLVDQHPVPDPQRGLHRATGDQEGLHHEVAEQQQEDGADGAEQRRPAATTCRGEPVRDQRRARPLLRPASGAEERSRSVCCASVSIGARAYPAALWTSASELSCRASP